MNDISRDLTRIFLAVCLFLNVSAELFADTKVSQTKIADPDTSETYYFIGFTGVRQNMRGLEVHTLTGNSVEINFGMKSLGRNWYLDGSVDIRQGPYEPILDRQLDSDYFGTGFTLTWGISAQNLDIRSIEGSYGFALSAKYLDIAGRSIGRNRSEAAFSAGDKDTIINKYSMRVNELSITPSIFFSWLTTKREKSNKPEHLKTRIEGYMINIGLSVPYSSRYKARYDLTERPSADNPDSGAQTSTITEHGSLRGYSFIIALSTLFDT
ncbi:MAG: hypothetical protein KBD78_05875 [Oligoflexales bacterium]|nr:hypothetical protein [Oligoflexales bacterium]